MASGRILLCVAVLLSAVAATTTAIGDSCVLGWGIPYNALPTCRKYVARRTCGLGPLVVPESVLQRRCCRELEDIAAYCRCGALSVLMDGGVAPGPGGRREEGLQELPGCPREAQRRFAATIITEAECNLAEFGSCTWLLGEDETAHIPSK